MADAKAHLETIGKMHEAHFGSAEQNNLARRMAEERARANVRMAEQFANLHMPEDIRSRARSWGMEAFCELLWSNAFQAGYREAMRDQSIDAGGA